MIIRFLLLFLNFCLYILLAAQEELPPYIIKKFNISEIQIHRVNAKNDNKKMVESLLISKKYDTSGVCKLKSFYDTTGTVNHKSIFIYEADTFLKSRSYFTDSDTAYSTTEYTYYPNGKLQSVLQYMTGQGLNHEEHYGYDSKSQLIEIQADFHKGKGLEPVRKNSFNRKGGLVKTIDFFPSYRITERSMYKNEESFLTYYKSEKYKLVKKFFNQSKREFKSVTVFFDDSKHCFYPLHRECFPVGPGDRLEKYLDYNVLGLLWKESYFLNGNLVYVKRFEYLRN
jgi:hypothetical protein